MGLAHHHRVLIIEDDRDCCDAVAGRLQVEGYEVGVAENGQVAFDQLRGGVAPCVIFLDLMMPVKDGWWFRAQQLRDQALAALPVIVMSGAGRVIEQAQQLGLQDYIEKPVCPELLLAMLERYCDQEY